MRLSIFDDDMGLGAEKRRVRLTANGISAVGSVITSAADAANHRSMMLTRLAQDNWDVVSLDIIPRTGFYAITLVAMVYTNHSLNDVIQSFSRVLGNNWTLSNVQTVNSVPVQVQTGGVTVRNNAAANAAAALAASGTPPPGTPPPGKTWDQWFKENETYIYFGGGGLLLLILLRR